MGINDDRERLSREDFYSEQSSSDRSDEQELLDTVLRETLRNNNREALELIFAVARNSEYPDTGSIHAVEEVVKAIMKHRFGNRQFTRRLIHRIACSLIEEPEATIRLERLWQEARASG